MTHAITSQNIYPYSWITLYNCSDKEPDQYHAMPARTTPQSVTSRKTVLILTIHRMSQFQTTQVCETLTCIQFVLPCCTCTAPSLAIFRTQRVCGAALHGSDGRHGIFSLLQAKPAPSPSTNTVLPPVANTTGLSEQSFTACLDRRAWKYKAPLLSLGISLSGTWRTCYACAMHYIWTSLSLERAMCFRHQQLLSWSRYSPNLWPRWFITFVLRPMCILSQKNPARPLKSLLLYLLHGAEPF